ncbi:unnamed protein product [Cuscuta europaea]|uniref:Uncharacterized protein n=1 Tax=Cuscuta europaea TaxID=41803 RepID=A0A9P0YIL2_CUSEU|nr:unnamed protein product [Cuscuta europaea]
MEVLLIVMVIEEDFRIVVSMCQRLETLECSTQKWGFEAWNFCNKFREEAPKMDSPKLAYGAHLSFSHNTRKGYILSFFLSLFVNTGKHVHLAHCFGFLD